MPTRGAAPPAIQLKGGHPPLIPPGYTVMGGGARAKTTTFLRENYKRRSRDCESLRMLLSVLGRVPAPVVGVNDAFLCL